MKKKLVFKDEFAVVGKAGEGKTSECAAWMPKLWEEANEGFQEIEGIVKKDESGGIYGMWGAMNDYGYQNKTWYDSEGGRYLAGCEIEPDAAIPDGWSKWIIPAQTYAVISCTMDKYGEVFAEAVNDADLKIIATIHERYPEPGNPSVVELYFPVAQGNIFCQSCGMPMFSDEARGTETAGSRSADYCRYCYKDGAFSVDETMEEMIETCIPFELEAGVYETVEEARESMLKLYPTFKRWSRGF